MVRIILGLVLGIVVALGIITVGEELIVRTFGLTTPQADSAAAFAAYLAAIPFTAKLCVVLGWFVGAFGGAWLALRIGDRGWMGWIVAAVVLAGGIANIVTLPHPLWMAIGAVLAPIAGGWLARRLQVTRHPGAPLLG